MNEKDPEFAGTWSNRGQQIKQWFRNALTWGDKRLFGEREDDLQVQREDDLQVQRERQKPQWRQIDAREAMQRQQEREYEILMDQRARWETVRLCTLNQRELADLSPEEQLRELWQRWDAAERDGLYEKSSHANELIGRRRAHWAAERKRWAAEREQRQLADLSNERGAAGRTRSLEDERRHQPADRQAKEGSAVTNELGASTPPKHRMEFKPGVPEEIRQMAEEAQRMESARKLQEVMARAVASTRPDVQTQRPTIVRKSEGQVQAAPQQAQKNDQRPTIVRKGQSPSQTAPSNTERPQIARKGQPAPAATPAQSMPAQKPRDTPSMQPRAR